MVTFVREDWTLFRSLGTLSGKAGVPVDVIPKLVAKELADNALDAAGAVSIGPLAGNGFFVADQGPGLPGCDEEIARLFSISRPLQSTKLLRLPTRGALGNGLRVVAGAVTATGGELTVCTNGRRLQLIPGDNGQTAHVNLGAWDGVGTRIDVRLGQSLQVGRPALAWAAEAALMAQGDDYNGKTSPHWYDTDSFFELLMAAGARPVRDLIASLDGCTGGKAGEIAKLYLGRCCDSLTRDDAESLLLSARALAKPVIAKRLGKVGPVDGLPCSYAIVEGSFRIEAARGAVGADLPFVVEAWVDSSEQKRKDIDIHVCVNKTPITASVSCKHMDNKIAIFGAGLRNYAGNAGRFKPVTIWLNVMTPYMPITSDGKAPDLQPMIEEIADAIERATNRAKRSRRQDSEDKQISQKDIVYAHVERAAAHLSQAGRYRFDQRNLFYEVRPALIASGYADPDYNYFTRILTEYENDYGDIAGMYRDNRGTLYHPHESDIIQLGTMQVEKYTRPEWQFNKILYIEKEGFFSILIDEGWPEKHDCALLTAKGQATRAAKDLLDFLGETGEDILFFCVHDADAYGTTIYQALQDATPSRPGRKVRVINLGLEAWEAVDMGLQIENLPAGKTQKPIADYVSDGWADWLQTHRCELNVMGPAIFLDWLDRKMEEYGDGKLIPPVAVQQEEYKMAVESAIRKALSERILKAAGIDDQVSSHMAGVSIPDDIVSIVQTELQANPVQSWRAPVEQMAVVAAAKSVNIGS